MSVSFLQVTSTKFVQPTFTTFLSDVKIFIYRMFFTFFSPYFGSQKGNVAQPSFWIADFMAQLLQSNSGYLQVFFLLGAEDAEEPPFINKQS